MMSTLAIKSGTLGRQIHRCLPIVVTRLSSTQAKLFPDGLVRSDTVSKSSTSRAEWQAEMEEKIARWDVLNDIYFGKDRDTKNYPILSQQEQCPPVRVAFLPYTWFEHFYSRTGVSGPYMLLLGVSTFIMSKEWVVFQHKGVKVGGFLLAYWFLMRKVLKPYIVPALDKYIEKRDYMRYTKPMADARARLTAATEEVEQDMWRKEGQKYVFQGMKENVDLQLEAQYRQRLNEVYTNVKKRLDYQVEVENAKRRFEQENMVNWITKSVIESITPQQEKDSLANCIKTLKSLSQQQQATV